MAPSFLKKIIWHEAAGLYLINGASCGTCDRDLFLSETIRVRMADEGLRLVDTPAEADIVMISGTITRRLREVILRTVALVPTPYLVVALGECAVSGGPFRDNPSVAGPLSSLLTVDLTIPGCPPTDNDIIDGLVEALSLLKNK